MNRRRYRDTGNRRHMTGVTTADFSAGYLRMLPPWALVKPWYMLGDHGLFCPVIFR